MPDHSVFSRMDAADCGGARGWHQRAKASMMVMIDDATNWTHAKFFESETTAAAMGDLLSTLPFS
jgi:hypothetical protein